MRLRRKWKPKEPILQHKSYGVKNYSRIIAV